jgi:hypothetical protein
MPELQIAEFRLQIHLMISICNLKSAIYN